MATKKKLSLKEFIQDESLGGTNWADDDFDPSSISVPVINHRPHNNLSYQSNSHQTFSQNNQYGGNYHSAGAGSPPFIVKLGNIPSYFGIDELRDLFSSRFMKFKKLKLFWDIHFDLLDSLGLNDDPLSTLNKRRKTSFVELESYQDFEKVLKWNDLYLDHGLGKISVNVGNFEDFRTFNDLNQKVSEFDDPSIPAPKKTFDRFAKPGGYRSTESREQLHHQPVSHNNPPINKTLTSPSQLNSNLNSNVPASTPALAPAPIPTPTVKKKSNPFGSAKPVDILSKQLEIEKTLKSLEINKTTYKTLGHQDSEDTIIGSNDKKQDAALPERPVKKEERKYSLKKPDPSLSSSSLNKKQTSYIPVSQPTSNPWAITKPTTPIQSITTSTKPAHTNSVSPELTKSSPQTFSQVASPPKKNAELYNQKISHVSASVFQSSNKKLNKNGEDGDVGDIDKKKVILKRKSNDAQKKDSITSTDGQASTLSASTTTDDTASKPSKIDESVSSTNKSTSSTEESIPPSKGRSSLKQNDLVKDRQPREPRDSRKKPLGRRNKPVNAENGQLDGESNKFNNKSYKDKFVKDDVPAVKSPDSSKTTKSNTEGSSNEPVKTTNSNPNNEDKVVEKDDQNYDGEGPQRGGFRGRGLRGSRGRGTRGRGTRGRGSRGRGGSSFEFDSRSVNKEDSTDGESNPVLKNKEDIKKDDDKSQPGTKGKDKTKESKSTDRDTDKSGKSSDPIPTSRKIGTKPKQEADTPTPSIDTKSEDSSNTRQPNTSSFRGRGRGNYRGRGSNRARFHNVSKSFAKSADSPAADSSK